MWPSNSSLSYFVFKDSPGRVKKLLLSVSVGVVFTCLKYFPNLTGMVVCLPLMNVLHFNDHVTWTCLPVSFMYIPKRKTRSASYLLRVHKFPCKWPEVGYLNESSDPYLDNFQSDLILTTLLSSHISFVSILCIFTEIDPPPLFLFYYYYFFYFP